MAVLVVVVNVLLAVVSLAFAVIAVICPAALTRTPARSGPGTEGALSGTGFFAAMYAGRAIPLSVLLTWTLLDPADGSARVAVLLTAAACQAVDVGLGRRHHNPGMLTGAATAGGIHLASAVVLATGVVAW